MQKVPEKKTEIASTPAISQKEYLQRYLMKSKGKKVKKKSKISSSSHIKRSIIIDDDVDLNTISNVDEEAFNLDYMGDEAPQICGYSDDRPLELQLKEKFSTGNWKSIGELEAEEEARRVEEENAASERRKEGRGEDVSPSRKKPGKRDKGRSERDDSDLSPSRNSSSKGRARGSDSDLSPPRKSDQKSRRQDDRDWKKGRQSDSDLSPARRGHKSKARHDDSDLSSMRKKSSKNRGNDSDLSPPRKKSNRSKESDSDLSPPRKASKTSAPSDLTVYQKSRFAKDDNRGRRNSDSHRRSSKKQDRDRGSPRREDRGKRRIEGSDSDLSPPRRNSGRPEVRRGYSRPLSERARDDADDSDLSPPRRNSNKRSQKLDKTLDGKTAGLQDAKRLKDELKALKDKEDKMFKKLDASVLGKSAAPVMRDRKTGQKRDLERERQTEKEKAEKESIRKNKYDRWGRGLKQVREREEQMADVLHEMSKPLARYKDDEDLDRLLKSREREGDPMLEYIRNKQEESHVVDLTVDGVRGKYRGNFMPNRFNIPPGHRWDGVDRSNGYEQKWFEAKSAKVAVEEEAWKWSSADM